MHKQLLVAGGGIGGLAAALASARAGWQVRVFEQAAGFGDTGAGVQLGPNATRVLRDWGLQDALDRVAAFPNALVVRSAVAGGELGRLRLGDPMRGRYGAPYATLHRADLHALLLAAVRQQGAVTLREGCQITGVAAQRDAVTLQTGSDLVVEGDALVGADGVWSTVRSRVLADGVAQFTGHVAYRTLALQSALPAAFRSTQVTAWLGPRLHVVTYPVRCGELLNVVVLAEGGVSGDAQDWDHQATPADLQGVTAGVCKSLRELIDVLGDWRLWALSDRRPMTGPHEMARGRVALLGDAAHPMLPYLAQGAGMAIEDAAVLAQSLALCPELDVPEALQRYAGLRWQRAARVQARARRNAEIFHASGAVRMARDLAMKLLGEPLLDMPWLYGSRV